MDSTTYNLFWDRIQAKYRTDLEREQQLKNAIRIFLCEAGKQIGNSKAVKAGSFPDAAGFVEGKFEDAPNGSLNFALRFRFGEEKSGNFFACSIRFNVQISATSYIYACIDTGKNYSVAYHPVVEAASLSMAVGQLIDPALQNVVEEFLA